MIALENKNEVLKFLYRYGHLRSPFSAEQDLPRAFKDVPVPMGDNYEEVEAALDEKVSKSRLTLKDECVKEAIRSFQSIDINFEDECQARHYRSVIADGDAGPATEGMLNRPRCLVPDHYPPGMVMEAYGSGNWKGCHDIGNFHALSIKQANSPPSWLAPLWDQIKSNVTTAFAEMGLMTYWDGRSPVGTELSFVGSAPGWIGLAIVCNNCTCNSGSIWLRLLGSYRGGNTDAQSITQWTTLTKHELCHNCGVGHLRGGVQNPSIVNGLPISFKGDPLESHLKSRFGGVPVPIGGPEPGRRLVIGYLNNDGTFEYLHDVPKVSSGPFPN